MAKNQPIGSCPCPVSKCAESAQVFRFRTMHTRDTQRRYAGKLYLICPQHGRLGMDGQKAMQDFILDNARMFDPPRAAPAETPAATPAAAPAPAAAKPAPAPAPQAKPATPAPKTETPTPRRSSADFDW